MLQGILRKSWSIKGKTPIHIQSQKHAKLSVISAITISPIREQLNLCFRIHQSNITQQQVIGFLKVLRKRIKGQSILIMDRWSVHKGKELNAFFAGYGKAMRIEWLPPYAPQLNPVEQLWSWCKYGDLHNLAPYDIDELNSRVDDSLARVSGQQKLLGSFFKKPCLAV